MTTRPNSKRPLYRHLREPVNSLTHLVGVLLSLGGLVALLALSKGEFWRTVSFGIYGVSLVTLYTASTLLHSLKVGPGLERRLRIFDHAAIFGLIAGTYTPITLVTLRPDYTLWAWTLFGIAWTLALSGVAFKIIWIGAPRWLSTALYLLMGWLSVVAAVPIVRALPTGGLVWLAAGGLCYSVGAVVYGLKKPDFYPRVFGYHELWHLFVLAGSFCHFMMMLGYVLPA